MSWKDITSYRSDEPRVPKTFVKNFAGVRVVLTQHIHYPGDWLVCFEPFLTHHKVGDVGDPVEDVQERAVECVRSVLQQALDHLDG